MRVRSTVTGAFSTSNYRAYQTRSTCAASWVTNTSLSQTSYSGEQSVKTIEDVQTPGFYSLLRCGKFLPLNPMTISTVRTVRTAGSGDHSWSFSSGCYHVRNTGGLWLSRTWLLDIPPQDEDLVEVVATNAIADCKAGVYDALTDLAEMEQTIDLVKTQFGRIFVVGVKVARLARDLYRMDYRRWLRDVRRFKKLKRRGRKTRRVKPPRNWKSFFSQLWLEYRYGWLPSIYSIRDAIAALRSKLEKGNIVTGKASVTVDLNDSKVEVTSPNAHTTRTEVCTITGSRTYRGKAYAEVQNSGATIQLDPITTAWELVPFSFVVDWGLEVGNWLQAWTPFSGSLLLGSQVSVKDSYVRTQTFKEVYFGSQDTGTFDGCSTQENVEYYVRFPHGAAVLPKWNLRLNPSRIADLFALLLGGRSSVMRYSSN